MRVLISLAALASLSACALGPSATGPRHLADPGPLYARIVPLGGTVAFHINRPAYVALFEITPGQGVSLVYPRFGSSEGLLYAGTHNVWRSSWRAEQAQYWGHVGDGSAFAQPRVYYLIASPHPLNTRSFIRSPYALRTALRGFAMTSASYRLMDELARLVVPHYASRDWVEASYVMWPPAPRGIEQPVRTWAIRCGDGRTMIVPVGMTVCPRDNVRQPPLTPPADTTRTADGRQRPDRRRPGVDTGADGEGVEAGAAPSRSGRTETSRRQRSEPRERAEPAPRRTETRGRQGSERQSEARPSRTREVRPAPPPRQPTRSTETRTSRDRRDVKEPNED